VAFNAPGRDVSRLAFFALFALQHRGQEGAGILTFDGATAHLHKGLGLVSQVFTEENLATLPGHLAIGHNRYSTTGRVSLRNTQPHVVETIDGPIAIAHNGNLVNGAELRRRLLERGVGLSTSSDTEILLQLLAGAGGAVTGTSLDRLRTVQQMAEGAYALTLLLPDGIWGMRDPWGLRPLVVGRLDDGGHVIASESCAFAAIGAKTVHELAPGQLVRLVEDGYEVHEGHAAPRGAFCTFEEIYFARPDTVFSGRLVHSARQELGAQLAREQPATVDVVLAVPDSGTPHAIGYARELGVPFTEGLIKNRYIGRTFIEPTPDLRRDRVAMKFNPLPGNLEGQRVALVDDSIVRGTTASRLVTLLREAGAAEVHLRVACPAIMHPCFMGVDMASRDELIAADGNLDAVGATVGADSIGYLSLAGLEAVLGDHGYCNACFTGSYPFAEIPVALRNGAQVAEVVL
jgi:amidophosphoribosyltransferase